jgi:hypothetical protein
MNQILIRIVDADDANYDSFALAPEGMDGDAARDAVDAMIRQVKDANPEEYLWEELEQLLVLAGFLPYGEIVTTSETW